MQSVAVPQCLYWCDLAGQRQHVTAVKWRLQSGHLVEDTAQRPDVGFLSVRLAFHHLGANTHTQDCEKSTAKLVIHV